MVKLALGCRWSNTKPSYDHNRQHTPNTLEICLFTHTFVMNRLQKTKLYAERLITSFDNCLYDTVSF